MGMEKIFICTVEKGNHYTFTCMKCGEKYELVTGDGCYGNFFVDVPQVKGKYEYSN